MFFSKPVIVSEIIALVFKRVESLILYFPACPTTEHDYMGIFFGQGKIGYPCVMITYFIRFF